MAGGAGVATLISGSTELSESLTELIQLSENPWESPTAASSQRR